jgi:hypothetical protein
MRHRPVKLIRRLFVMDLCRGPAGDGAPFAFVSTTPAWMSLVAPRLDGAPPGTGPGTTWVTHDTIRPPCYRLARLPSLTPSKPVVFAGCSLLRTSSHFLPDTADDACLFSFADPRALLRLKPWGAPCEGASALRREGPAATVASDFEFKRRPCQQAASSRCGTQHATQRWST